MCEHLPKHKNYASLYIPFISDYSFTKCNNLKQYTNLFLTDSFLATQAVISSPELATSQPWLAFFSSKAVRDRVCLLAIDEAHCLCDW